MKKKLLLILFCVASLTACKNKDATNSNTKPISNLESPMSIDTTTEKGSITNPYDGLNEYFQITCQIPDYGKESEIVLEFSNMYLSKTKIGWLMRGNITFISGCKNTPIHINDYVTGRYYNSTGIIGFGRNDFFDSDSDDGDEFVFTKNNYKNASIHNQIKFEDLDEQNPQVGCIKYFDGTEYREVFFCK
ncbi:hypothetical protein [Anaerosporobacter sp.]|uniref:hypothetical protein n=1 Tax=Anaerosporobacter sp. TaxID=1872529 RepID=UPI00286F2613|nr:hypothetical protein [Anaerosporobacter sp.]